MSEVTSGFRRTVIYSGRVHALAEENFGKAEALLNGIPSGVYKAVGSGLARAASAGKTEAKRAVAQEYTIVSGDFLRYTKNINHFVRGGDGDAHYQKLQKELLEEAQNKASKEAMRNA